MNDITAKLSEFIGILPDNKLFHSHPRVYRRLLVVHAIYNSIITLYPVAYAIIYMEERYGNISKAEMACDIMTLVKNVFYAFIASFSLLYRNVFYPTDYIIMKGSFQEIDELIEKHGIKLVKHNRWLRFLIFNIAFVVYIIYSFHVFGHEAHIIYNILINWVHFNFLVEIMLAWRWLEYLHERLTIFNELINMLLWKQGECKKRCGCIVYPASPEPTEYFRRSVLDLIDIHKRLLRIVNIFNVFMGLSVALRSLIFIIGTLSVVLRISAELWEDFSLSIIDTCVDGCGWFIFILKAQHVIDQGRKSINVCLDVTSTWLEEDNKTEEERALLAHLTQRVTTQVPQFSAARFYSIDFAAFFMIVNMTTGYIVIVVQFAYT